MTAAEMSNLNPGDEVVMAWATVVGVFKGDRVHVVAVFDRGTPYVSARVKKITATIITNFLVVPGHVDHPAVPSTASNTAPITVLGRTAPQSNGNPSSSATCDSVKQPCKPRCPGCGNEHEFNYVGFSTVECVTPSCKFFCYEAAKRACEAMEARNGQTIL